MMKKVLAVLLSLVMALSMVCIANAEEGNVVRKDTTDLTDGTYRVDGTVKLENVVNVSGNVTLMLEEGSVLVSPKGEYYAMAINPGATLTIEGTGTIQGSVFAMTATVNINGGVIESDAEYGYCLDAEENAVVNINGGILQNSYFGVSLRDSTVTMNGGAIQGCTYGIQSYGQNLSLLGGTISNCYIGVWTYSTELVLGGSIRIKGNKQANLDLESNEGFKISEAVPPTDEMLVGLTLGVYLADGDDEYEVEGVPGEYAAHYFSDAHDYYFRNDSGKLMVGSYLDEMPMDGYLVYRLNEKALQGKEVTYTWYGFDKKEIQNDESVISFASSDEERYAGVLRSYDVSNGIWTIENPITEEQYYEDQDTAADFILHVPAETLLTFQGTLNGLSNQFEIGVSGEDTDVAVGCYDSMPVEFSHYLEDKGDYRLYAMYYPEAEQEETTGSFAISQICFWSKNNQAVGNQSELSGDDLADGYYVCEAVVTENGKTVDTFTSDIVYSGIPDCGWEDLEEEEPGDEDTGSVVSAPKVVLLASGAAVLAVAAVVLSRKKKKRDEE